MSNSVNFYEFIGFITYNIEVHELVLELDRYIGNTPSGLIVGQSEPSANDDNR